MGRPALAATYHLSSGVAARRYDHHVLAPGAARASQRSADWLDRPKMRAGAVAAKHRSIGRDCGFKITAAARRGAKGWTAGDRPFRIDLSQQAAPCAARHMCRPQATRVKATD